MLLMLYIYAHLTTVMDSSSEFHQLAFAHGVTVEGQFLASLAPATRGEATCPCRAAQDNVMTASASSNQGASGVKDESMWNAGADDSQRFWRVRLHDDDEHTLDYAMETVERVLRQEVVGPHGLVRRAKVQWVAYQAHHYGLGLVAVLPELRARRALSNLERAGLSCSIVPE